MLGISFFCRPRETVSLPALVFFFAVALPCSFVHRFLVFVTVRLPKANQQNNRRKILMLS